MNKRRRAYKKHREQRIVPVEYAWNFYADDVSYVIEPPYETRRKYNAFKRKHGIPQKMCVKVIMRMDGTTEYRPMAKERKGLFLVRYDETVATAYQTQFK